MWEDARQVCLQRRVCVVKCSAKARGKPLIGREVRELLHRLHPNPVCPLLACLLNPMEK